MDAPARVAMAQYDTSTRDTNGRRPSRRSVVKGAPPAQPALPQPGGPQGFVSIIETMRHPFTAPEIVAEITGPYGPVSVSEKVIQRLWARGAFMGITMR